MFSVALKIGNFYIEKPLKNVEFHACLGVRTLMIWLLHILLVFFQICTTTAPSRSTGCSEPLHSICSSHRWCHGHEHDFKGTLCVLLPVKLLGQFFCEHHLGKHSFYKSQYFFFFSKSEQYNFKFVYFQTINKYNIFFYLLNCIHILVLGIRTIS